MYFFQILERVDECLVGVRCCSECNAIIALNFYVDLFDIIIEHGNTPAWIYSDENGSTTFAITRGTTSILTEDIK